MCANCKNTIERGMILEDEPLLRPVYLPFSVGESGGRTLFERTSPADGGRSLPNGRTLPRLYIPEGERLWKRWSTRWWSWP